ncbi:hypothetical protein ZWY2020_003362, partial [Hordeum vulgare]
ATIALAGAAVGIGNVLSSVARNPSLAKQSFGYAILGFALTEAIALFGLLAIISVVIVNAVAFTFPSDLELIPVGYGRMQVCPPLPRTKAAELVGQRSSQSTKT